jgi:hypothetical protein
VQELTVLTVPREAVFFIEGILRCMQSTPAAAEERSIGLGRIRRRISGSSGLTEGDKVIVLAEARLRMEAR